MKPCARSNDVLVGRLLTGTAVLTLALASSASFAGPLARDLPVVAQAQPSAGEAKPDADKDKKGRPERREQRGPATRPAPSQGQPAKPPAPPKVEAPKVEAPKPAAPPAAKPPAAAPKPAAPAAPPPAAPKPATPPQHQTAPKPVAPPPAKPAAPAAQPPKAEPPHAAPAAPAATPPKTAAPKEAPKEPPKEAPKAETPKAATPPAAQRPAAPTPAPSAAQPQQRAAPPAANAPAAAPAAPAAAAAPPPPTTPRKADEFLLKKGESAAAAPQINDVRKERRETREGDRTIYRERDRTIVRDGNRTFIRHNESNRFAIDARDVRSQRRDGNTVTIVERPNGVQIVTITDDDGDLIRRIRRQNGKDIIIIDNSRERHRDRDRDYHVVIDLPPPVIRIPRDRYIIDARRAPRDVIYGAFLAPPVMTLDRTYTLEQVRYSAPLRERMPRVDLDVNFDTGSWQLAPDQIDELAVIAEGIKRAIARNPREVFMIEGYTDAVGSEIDNLSLSDRRAEAVAVALTDEFGVPPENLVTQGYGEQYLKIDTQGAERANRRVAVRRITPLIDQQAKR